MPQGDLNLLSASDVSSLVVEMFGSVPMSTRGVIHVGAVGTGNQVLKITPDSPTSPYDAFVLSLSRARAHYVVTTGKILRDEPDLTHAFLGNENTRRAMSDWRSNVLDIREPVHTLVLTSGKRLDGGHPIFRSGRPVTVVTSLCGGAELRAQSFEAAEIVTLDEPNGRAVIDFALGQRAPATVSVEAGPSTAAQLYKLPVVVDELFLSTFHGAVPAALLGDAFVDEDGLEKLFHRCSSYRVADPKGDWIFARYVK